MPISREEWDQGVINPALPISDLLRSRPDLAFTVEDVLNMLIAEEGRGISVEDVEQALDILVSSGRIHKKETRGQRWYTIVQRRMGFLRE